MATTVISDNVKSALETYLDETSAPELVNTYLCFIQNKFNIQPVLYPKNKVIYHSAEEAIRKLDKEGGIWRETEIKISFGGRAVNEETKRIYICPYTGKVFGDNTHPNPQDAIYDWVSKCPENNERIGGLRVKRFYVSEDSEVIKNYAEKVRVKEPIVKTVYSSMMSGKLFNTKEAVVKDFKKNYLKKLTLMEVQNQNRYEIEEGLLEFIQAQLEEEKITGFVEAMASVPEFQPYVEYWLK